MSTLVRSLVALSCLATVGPALAQTGAPSAAESKSVAVEYVPAFPALQGWVNVQVAPVALPAAPASVQSQPLALAAPAGTAVYQPLAVIMGVPELPLIGGASAARGPAWPTSFNYQGMHMQLLVLDPSGTQVQPRALADGLRVGERFKIRVATTFEAVASIDQVVGDPWYGQRTGQVYPRPGLSVLMHAGEVVDLPLGDAEFFSMNPAINERLVVGVRHPAAQGATRSQQPAYRQDERSASAYLQLVPRGQWPAFEQQITALAR